MLEDENSSDAFECVGDEVPPILRGIENGIKKGDGNAEIQIKTKACQSAWRGYPDSRNDRGKSVYEHLRSKRASQGRRLDVVSHISARGRSDYPDDLELLELLIGVGGSRRNPCQIALSLYRRFGSFEGVIAASVTDLMTVTQMSINLVTVLKIVHSMVERVALSKLRQPNSISNTLNVQSYLHAVLPKDGKSEYRILHFGASGRLLSDDIAEGSIGARPYIYPRNVISRCLELGTASVVIGTNREEILEARTRYGETEAFFRVKEALSLFDVHFRGILVLTKSGFQPVLCDSE